MHAFSPFRLVTGTAALALLAGSALAQAPLAQAPQPRPTPAAGSIVAAKGGEELKFVQEAGWRPAEIRQDLIDGDTLRTNAIGNLAILFADQTQIRVGRNSTLMVRDVAVGAGGSTQLDLQAGNVWARAARGAGPGSTSGRPPPWRPSGAPTGPSPWRATAGPPSSCSKASSSCAIRKGRSRSARARERSPPSARRRRSSCS